MKQIDRIKRKKNKYKPKKFCTLYQCPFLIEYMEAVYDLQFDEKPDYSYLRFLFEKNLMNEEMIPDNKFDWILPNPQIEQDGDQIVERGRNGAPK